MATADLAPVAIVKRAKTRKVLIRRGKFSMIVDLDLNTGIITANGKAAKLDSESLRKLRDQGFSPGNGLDKASTRLRFGTRNAA